MHSTAGGWKRSLRSYGMTASLSASSPVSLSFSLLVSCSLYVRACACVYVRVCAVRVCDRPSFLSCLKITAVTRFEPPAVGLVLKSAAITFVFRLSSSLAQWLAPAPSCWRAYVTFTCLDGCCHVSWLGQALARQLSQTSRQVQMGAPHTSAAGAERLISRPLSAVSLSLWCLPLDRSQARGDLATGTGYRGSVLRVQRYAITKSWSFWWTNPRYSVLSTVSVLTRGDAAVYFKKVLMPV